MILRLASYQHDMTLQIKRVLISVGFEPTTYCIEHQRTTHALELELRQNAIISRYLNSLGVETFLMNNAASSSPSRTVASSLEVVRPYCVVVTTTPTFTYSLVQVPINVVRAWPYLPA